MPNKLINEKRFMEEMSKRINMYEKALKAKKLPQPKLRKDCKVCDTIIDHGNCNHCPIEIACQFKWQLRATAQNAISDEITCDFRNIKHPCQSLSDRKELIRQHLKNLLADLDKAGYEVIEVEE